MTDIEKVRKRFPDCEIDEIVASFAVHIKGAPIDLRVEVQRTAVGYMGFSNYSIWGPQQASPYKSLQACRTIEDALEDSINGLLAFYDKNDDPEKVFWVKRDPSNPNEDVHIAATGETVTEAEAVKRRAQK